MADLFLELLSEEMPARMQVTAQAALKELVTDELLQVKLNFQDIESFSTPRRLLLVIKGLAEKTLPEFEEKRGPSVLAPKKAIEGFCKAMNAKKSELFLKEEKKGQFYFFRMELPSQLNSDLIPAILTRVVKYFPWPRSMRWGSGSLRWVRPLRSIVCVLSNDNDSKVLPLEFDGLVSNNLSVGHRVLSPDQFSVLSFEDYQEKIRHRYVIFDRIARKNKIINDARNLAFAAGLDLVEDPNLLEEVTGLVEWPVVLIGKIDREFLTLPPKVLQVSMREHQKFFSLRNKKTKIIDSFIMVANIVSEDDKNIVIKGNERVLRARLSDAKFFWENDLRQIKSFGYESFAEKLCKVTFHNKLGTEADRLKRISKIAVNIATLLNTEIESTRTAVSLCKLDLVSEMVFEFPELQGFIGQQYALKAGFKRSIADACYEHYLPRGQLDRLPEEPISIVLALADRIDTISSFWSINLKPTGSKDPFALRRAAIGVIRILIENKVPFSLVTLLKLGNSNLDFDHLIDFFNERIRSQFIEKGLRFDVLNSLQLKDYQSLTLSEMLERAIALNEFVKTNSGKDLIQGYKRAVNILSAEENKDGVEYSFDPEKKLLRDETELTLYENLVKIDKKNIDELEKEKVRNALENLSTLRRPIDKFFHGVQINSENSIVRRNRLCLLNKLRAVMHRVADFSQIDGDL